MVVVGVRERGAPRPGLALVIPLEDALVVGDSAKSEWEHASLVGVGVAHGPGGQFNRQIEISIEFSIEFY